MTIKTSLLVFGTKNFNNSLKEVEEYLNFTLVFFDKNTFSESWLHRIDLILLDSEICIDTEVLDLIKEIQNKPLFLLQNEKFLGKKKLNTAEIINLPASCLEIHSKITNIIISKKFNQNSSIKIKEYTVDKNERCLKNNDLSIVVTEREIELIELLSNEQKPLSKNMILKKVWKYAVDADTHTVETHIYRLRKKILNKFKDDNFIISSKAGYSI